jgi:hypothetical protein
VATGTHTINSLPWGTGLVAGGVALNNSAAIQFGAYPFYAGRRLPNVHNPAIAVRDGDATPWAAMSVYDFGMNPGARQLWTSVIDFPANGSENPALAALARPRHGITLPFLGTWYDLRIAPAVVDDVRARSLPMTPVHTLFLDNGGSAILALRHDGRVYGAADTSRPGAVAGL